MFDDLSEFRGTTGWDFLPIRRDLVWRISACFTFTMSWSKDSNRAWWRNKDSNPTIWRWFSWGSPQNFGSGDITNCGNPPRTGTILKPLLLLAVSSCVATIPSLLYPGYISLCLVGAIFLLYIPLFAAKTQFVRCNIALEKKTLELEHRG